MKKQAAWWTPLVEGGAKLLGAGARSGRAVGRGLGAAGRTVAPALPSLGRAALGGAAGSGLDLSIQANPDQIRDTMPGPVAAVQRYLHDTPLANFPTFTVAGALAGATRGMPNQWFQRPGAARVQPPAAFNLHQFGSEPLAQMSTPAESALRRTAMAGPRAVRGVGSAVGSPGGAAAVGLAGGAPYLVNGGFQSALESVGADSAARNRQHADILHQDQMRSRAMGEITDQAQAIIDRSNNKYEQTTQNPTTSPVVTPPTNNFPNWAKGLGAIGGGAAAGLLTNAITGEEEDEETGEKKQRMPWLGPAVGLGTGMLGAHMATGGNLGNMANMDWWKGASVHSVPLVLVPYKVKLAAGPDPLAPIVPPGPNPVSPLTDQPPVQPQLPTSQPTHTQTQPSTQNQLPPIGLAPEHVMGQVGNALSGGALPVPTAGSWPSPSVPAANTLRDRIAPLLSGATNPMMPHVGLAAGALQSANAGSREAPTNVTEGSPEYFNSQQRGLNAARGGNPQRGFPQDQMGGHVNVIAQRALSLEPNLANPTFAQQRANEHLQSQGLWGAAKGIWAWAGQQGTPVIGGMTGMQLLIAAGLSVGALGLLGSLTGNKTFGGGTGALLGAGGALAAAYGAGAFHSGSPLQTMVGGLWGAPRNPTSTLPGQAAQPGAAGAAAGGAANAGGTSLGGHEQAQNRPPGTATPATTAVASATQLSPAQIQAAQTGNWQAVRQPLVAAMAGNDKLREMLPALPYLPTDRLLAELQPELTAAGINIQLTPQLVDSFKQWIGTNQAALQQEIARAGGATASANPSDPADRAATPSAGRSQQVANVAGRATVGGTLGNAVLNRFAPNAAGTIGRRVLGPLSLGADAAQINSGRQEIQAANTAIGRAENAQNTTVGMQARRDAGRTDPITNMPVEPSRQTGLDQERDNMLRHWLGLRQQVQQIQERQQYRTGPITPAESNIMREYNDVDGRMRQFDEIANSTTPATRRPGAGGFVYNTLRAGESSLRGDDSYTTESQLGLDDSARNLTDYSWRRWARDQAIPRLNERLETLREIERANRSSTPQQRAEMQQLEERLGSINQRVRDIILSGRSPTMEQLGRLPPSQPYVRAR